MDSGAGCCWHLKNAQQANCKHWFQWSQIKSSIYLSVFLPESFQVVDELSYWKGFEISAFYRQAESAWNWPCFIVNTHSLYLFPKKFRRASHFSQIIFTFWVVNTQIFIYKLFAFPITFIQLLFSRFFWFRHWISFNSSLYKFWFNQNDFVSPLLHSRRPRLRGLNL